MVPAFDAAGNAGHPQPFARPVPRQLALFVMAGQVPDPLPVTTAEPAAQHLERGVPEVPGQERLPFAPPAMRRTVVRSAPSAAPLHETCVFCSIPLAPNAGIVCLPCQRRLVAEKRMRLEVNDDQAVDRSPTAAELAAVRKGGAK